MKRKIEISIGVFVFTGLVLLATMIVSFSGYEYSGGKYPIYTVFNFVSGVVVGAPVRYAGVDVGKVSKADLFESPEGKTQVRLTLLVKQGVKIKNDSEAVINSLGIIGEKYIELFPGSAEAPALQSGGEINGVDPVAIESVMAKAQQVFKRLDEALSAVNNILTSDTQQDIRATIVNFKNFGQDVDTLTKKIDIVMDKINSGEGTLGKLIYAQDLHDELLALIKGMREHGIFYKEKETTKQTKQTDTKKKAKQGFGPRE